MYLFISLFYFYFYFVATANKKLLHKHHTHQSGLQVVILTCTNNDIIICIVFQLCTTITIRVGRAFIIVIESCYQFLVIFSIILYKLCSCILYLLNLGFLFLLSYSCSYHSFLFFFLRSDCIVKLKADPLGV